MSVSRPEHVDILIVGGGLSGIGAACRLQQRFPGRSYAVLEARDAVGGTWDLFRYPGVRSDSDMATLGYPFRPWHDVKTLGSGAGIAEYIRDTAHDTGVLPHIRVRHRVVSAQWSTADARWTVEVDTPGGRRTMTTRFLLLCSGYYRYDRGYRPDFADEDAFRGSVIHPQHWPEDYDYRGKRVVVIGSGATAVTLVPAMAQDAAHVTMVQRSPTYIVSAPSVDPVVVRARRWLPRRLASSVVRWRSIIQGQQRYAYLRANPEKGAAAIKAGVAAQLPDFARYEADFTPRYRPWDQRLCLVPDGDLFAAIRDERASIVTGRIERFTPSGLQLEDGRTIDADAIITATGLELHAGGGIRLEVDGRPVSLGDSMLYKGVLLTGIPNAGFWLGYVNSSWTLRADASARYVCRLLAHLDRTGYDWAVPVPEGTQHTRPALDLASGYVERGSAAFPKVGEYTPWTRSHYIRDVIEARFSRVTRSMSFGRRVPHAASPRS